MDFGLSALLISLATTAMSTMQAQQNMKRQAKAQQKAANEAAKQRWEDYEKAEKKRKDQLKKALAKRRAQMGASGLSSADGSASAIMQGLRTDSVEASIDDYENAQRGINNSFSEIQANLLEQSNEIKDAAFKDLSDGLLGSFKPKKKDNNGEEEK